MRALLGACLLLVAGAAGAEPPTLADFARHAEFGRARLSPDGLLLAALVPRGEETHVAVLRVADKKVIGALRAPDGEHAVGIYWANNERVVIAVGTSEGALEAPLLTGELLAVNADGSQRRYLYGYRDNDYGYGEVLHTLPAQKDWIAIAATKASQVGDQRSWAHTLNVYSGNSSKGILQPGYGAAHFVFDDAGALRYAVVENEKDLKDRAYRYDEQTRGWTELAAAGREGSLWPFRARASDGLTFVESRLESDRTCLAQMDAVGEVMPLSCDAASDLMDAFFSADGQTPLAAFYESGRPQLDWVNPDHPDARLLRALQKNFPEQLVLPVSWSLDGSRLLIEVSSDRNPGELYLFDRKTNRADFLYAYRSWIDPAEMGERRPVEFESRDGALLRGYLTLPPRRPEQDLPLVVIPHGGPFGIRDGWGWDGDAQLLATRGYAVLQVNFRGSGGAGAGHFDSAKGKWGTMMIDDITDGVRHVIDAGTVDKDRICIFGGSYGGYAALMSAVREPDLYQCVVGYVGVYDLVAFRKSTDVRRSRSGRNYMAQFIGDDPAELERQSPINHLDALKAPVFIVHGELDKRAPFSESKALRAALEKRDHPYEWLAKSKEGHGFYNEQNREELYRKLLDFVGDHIGPGAPPE